MSSTGNVFMDAFVNAGMQMSSGVYSDWGTKEDYRYPFSVPRTRIDLYLLEKGFTKIYNVIRRTALPVDMKWILSCNAIKTDNALLTWMKANTGLLRIVDSEQIDLAYRKEMKEFFSEEQDYSRLPGSYKEGLRLYVEYFVVRSRFIIHVNRVKTQSLWDDIEEPMDQLESLNWLSEHKELIEFIPVIINKEYEISHRAYRKGRYEYDAVQIAYSGCGILSNQDIMNKLKDWLDEGNSINPRSEYYILTNRDDRTKYYLRKKKDDTQ